MEGSNAMGNAALSNDISVHSAPPIHASSSNEAAQGNIEWPVLGSHFSDYCLQEVIVCQGSKVVAKTYFRTVNDLGR